MGTSVAHDKQDGISVIEHSSGNYVVAGYDSTSTRDGLVFALDPSGNLLWQSCIGTSSTHEGFEDVIEGHNGNIIAVGYHELGGYLVELDPANGSIVTTKTYNTVLPMQFTAIDRTSNGYVITGWAGIGSATRMVVIAVDNSYNVLWSKFYISSSESKGLDIKAHNDTIFVSGTTQPVSNSSQSVLTLVALSGNGNILWKVGFEDQFMSAFFWSGLDISPTGPVCVGWKTLGGASGVAYRGLMVKTDFSGSILAMDTCSQVEVVLSDTPFTVTTGSVGTRTQNLLFNSLSINITQLTDHDSICVAMVACSARLDSLRPDTLLCVSDTAGYVKFWFSDITPPITHHLSNGQTYTGDSIGPLPPGFYIDTIIDAAGCIIIDSFEIVLLDTLRIDSIKKNDPTTCGSSDGWIKVYVSGGTPPYNISWSTGASGDSIGSLSQGSYYVTITDNNGCAIYDTIVLTPLNGLTVTATVGEPLCAGDSTGWIKVTVAGGQGPYTHVWSNGLVGDSISNLPAGTYIDSVYDAIGCWALDTIVVTSPAPITISNVQSSPPSSCDSSDGWIKITPAGGIPPYNVSWSTGATGDSIGNLSSGSYVVTITDSNGCSFSDTIDLQGPDAPQVDGLIVNNPRCAGDSTGSVTISISGGTPPYTHNWSHGVSTNSNTISNLSAGTYTDTIVDATGCRTVVTVTISEPPPLEVNVSVTQPKECSSNDGFIEVQASGGKPPYSYQWNTGDTGRVLNNLSPGTYTVSVIDSNGCRQTQQVFLSAENGPQVSSSSELLSCSPPQYVVNLEAWGVSQPYVVYWDTYDTTTSLTDTLPPGTYIVIVDDGSGCIAVDTVVLPPMDTLWVEATPTIDTISPGDTVVLHGSTNAAVWWWSPGEFLNDSLSLNPIAQPITTTTFYLYAVTASGCVAIDTVIIVVEGEPIVYFPDYFSPNGDGNNDLFRPIYWGNVKIQWWIYNRWSEIVFRGTEQDAWDGTYRNKPQQMDSYVLVATIIPQEGEQRGKPVQIVKNILLIR